MSSGKRARDSGHEMDQAGERGGGAGTSTIAALRASGEEVRRPCNDRCRPTRIPAG